MPVLRVVSNAAATNDQKLAFVTGASSVFFEVLRVPKEHIHVMIEDGQFFAFGGDAKTPAAWVTIHASRGQILEGSRKHVVDGLMPLLKDLLGCGPERTTSFFMEVPVENIAVGDAIIQFSSPRSPQGGLANIRTL